MHEVCLLTNFTPFASEARLTVAVADIVAIIVDTLPIVLTDNATCMQITQYCS